MIILAKGKANAIFVKVNAVEDLIGFSATLTACGTAKTATFSDKNLLKFIFAKEEIARVTEASGGEYGTLTICDTTGKMRIKARPQFRLMELDDNVIPDSDRTIFVSLPKPIDIKGGGGGDTPIDPSIYATKTELQTCVVEIHNAIDEATSHSASWEVKDEDEDGQPDGETLYFHQKAK